MGIFGKKAEKKEDVTGSNEAKVNTDVTPEVPTAPTAQVASGEIPPPPPPPETPEQQREKTAYKMMITMYPDNFEIKLEGVQNLTQRIVADIMLTRAFTTYRDDAVANASALKLVDTLAKMKDAKRILVPGSK